MPFKGKPPGSGSGEMSRRTAALRPAIALDPGQASRARSLRREGHEPGTIAAHFGVPVEEVEKAKQILDSTGPVQVGMHPAQTVVAGAR